MSETEPMKRPEDFRMAFQSKPEGIASIYVPAFKREHIPFLLKALAVADEILALDTVAAPTAKGDSDAQP
jgi:hypothetical protein